MQWLPAAKCHISLCCRPAICLPPPSPLLPPTLHRVRLSCTPGSWKQSIPYHFHARMCVWFVPESVFKKYSPQTNISQYTPLGAGNVWPLYLIWYHPFCQEVHPCSATNIDSVKIDTSLIMAREWVEYLRRPRDQEPREISRSEGTYIVQPNPVRLEAVLAILL